MGEPTPATKLLEMLHGYRAVQALYVGAQLGIPELLREVPKRSDELASATGAHAGSLRRLMRALASLGVLVEMDDGRFALTTMGEQLRSDAPGSLRPAVLFYGGRRHWTAWSQLLESVKTGRTAFGIRSADKFSEMAARDPGGAAVFNEAMDALTTQLSATIAERYDFSAARLVVDVGGGYGALLGRILTANPRLHGILFDIEAVIEQARQRIDAARLASRCDVVAGDAFDAVPSGGDVYILKWILHDWDDDSSVRILTNCRRAMSPDAKLLIVERVLPRHAEAATEAANAFLSDLNMLLLSGGGERTEEEYRVLLAAADLQLRRAVGIGASQFLLEASVM